MQVGAQKLLPSLPFHGVTKGEMLLSGKSSFRSPSDGGGNFCIENIIFDMAEFDLPYNAILGCPILTKFMVVVHYSYATLKIPGPAKIISIRADVKGSVHCTEKLYKAIAS